MISLVFSLTLFLMMPFIWVGLALNSWVMVAAGFALVLFLLIYFFMTAFQKFIASENALLISEDSPLGIVLKRVKAKVGLENQTLQFWLLPQSSQGSKVWVFNRSSRAILLDQGLMSRLTENELCAWIEKLIQVSAKETALQNRLYALTLWFQGVKGPEKAFRYWFCSFWFYPLERFLKIAKI